ncbi:hypothetical protein DPMN_095322 [Dreissena polymorpha]|uniref:Uncharacterized protein n=1 Tax=Dreissena polymorpha TaxID=45954 RepID=A0A9D4L694_DREPO|nr:hypothetical protein DPMN_095322 [Dreissena polymorpha]
MINAEEVQMDECNTKSDEVICQNDDVTLVKERLSETPDVQGGLPLPGLLNFRNLTKHSHS